MEKITKKLSMLLMALLFLVPLASCGSDDDGPSGEEVDDYYAVCSSVSGGGYTAQQLDNFMSDINSELTSYYWEGITFNKAKYNFNSLMDVYEDIYSDGISSCKGTLTITFQLKSQKSGKVLQTAKLYVTKDGCERD